MHRAIIAILFLFLISCAKKTQDLISVDSQFKPGKDQTNEELVTKDTIHQANKAEVQQVQPTVSKQADTTSYNAVTELQPVVSDKVAVVVVVEELSKPIDSGSQAALIPEVDQTVTLPTPVETALGSTETTTSVVAEPRLLEKETQQELTEPVAPLTESDQIEIVEELLDQRPSTFPITPAILFPDSAFEGYMILPGDYLIKIAKKEYNDWRKWREIYSWNRAEIGDNPNLIFPYHFLDLFRPTDQLKECKLAYYTHSTQSGESLWTIAKAVYGDEFTWIVLFWDNEEILDLNEGVLYPGMELKVREHLDPCNPTS